MGNFILEHEPLVRLGCFAAVLIGMAAWETWAPRRRRAFPRRDRWPGNLGIVALNTGLLRVVFPLTAVGFAALIEDRGMGLLHQTALPGWARIAVAFVLLDLTIYLQHVVLHAVPALWRLHRMHHADLDFDVTTGVRFHPIEILLSMVLKLAAIAAIGAPPVAVLLFEVMLNATSMFDHTNASLPAPIDKLVRTVLVTPDMHRVHHSVRPNETNSNFGFNLAWWDRLLGTYRAQPEDGHEGMTIGVEEFRDRSELRFDRLLVQPFIGPAGSYPINRRDSAR